MQSVADWWNTFWDHTEFWNAFWPACIGAFVGAVVATSLTRLYRKSERIDRRRVQQASVHCRSDAVGAR